MAIEWVIFRWSLRRESDALMVNFEWQCFHFTGEVFFLFSGLRILHVCAPLDSIALIVIAFKNVQEASRRAVCCCRIRHSVDRVSSSRQPFFLLLSFLFRCLASTTVCYHFYFPPLDQLTVFVCNFARESAEHISGPYSSTRTGQAHAIRTSERKTKTKHWKNAIREDECWACVLSGTPMCILIRF